MVCMVKRLSRVCGATLLLPLLSQAQGGASGDVDIAELLIQASHAYEQGSYAEAVTHYEGIVSTGVSNGSLYYNRGNAYMRAGQPGRPRSMRPLRFRGRHRLVWHIERRRPDRLRGRQSGAIAGRRKRFSDLCCRHQSRRGGSAESHARHRGD